MEPSSIISAQALRSTIIAGRPDIGQPDWRGDLPGHPLTDANVTDLIACMIAQRPAFPGRPYPDDTQTSEQPDNHQPAPVQRPPVNRTQ